MHVNCWLFWPPSTGALKHLLKFYINNVMCSGYMQHALEIRRHFKPWAAAREKSSQLQTGGYKCNLSIFKWQWFQRWFSKKTKNYKGGTMVNSGKPSFPSISSATDNSWRTWMPWENINVQFNPNLLLYWKLLSKTRLFKVTLHLPG